MYTIGWFHHKGGPGTPHASSDTVQGPAGAPIHQAPREPRERVEYDVIGRAESPGFLALFIIFVGVAPVLRPLPQGWPASGLRPATAYLGRRTPSRGALGFEGQAAEASTYKVWRVAPSAGVRGPALLLLGLHLSLGGAVRTVPVALVPAAAASPSSSFASPSSSFAAAAATAARLPLAVALVVVWVLAVAWRAPPAGVAPVPVAVGGVLAALDGDASGPGDVGRLCSLEIEGGDGVSLGSPSPLRVV